MKRLWVILFVLPLFGQNHFQVKLDSLKQLKNNALLEKGKLGKYLIELEKQIKQTDNEISRGKLNTDITPVKYRLMEKGQIWIDKPSLGKRVKFYTGAKVLLYPKWYKNTKYIYAEYGGEFGWLSDVFYDNEKLPQQFILAEKVYREDLLIAEANRKKEIKEEKNRKMLESKEHYKILNRERQEEADKRMKEQDEAREKDRKFVEERLKLKYGDEISSLMIRHRIQIGWTKVMVEESIGYSVSKSKDTYTFGTQTQMVYNTGIYSYVYLENGIVTSFTERY